MLEYKGKKKFVMVVLDTESPVDMESVKEAWEFAESLKVPNPVKELQEVDDSLWGGIVTSLSVKGGIMKVLPRIWEDEKEVTVRLTLGEWSAILESYLLSVKKEAESLSKELKKLVSAYAKTASMSKMAKGIAEKLGSLE